MRFFIVLLAISTLAAAGPIPSVSNAALETCTSPSVPANYTLGSDTIAALTNLKAVYDSLNPEPSSNLKVKRDFWHWLKETFESPGLKARSPVPTSTSANKTLDSDPISALTRLKAIYDSLNEKRMESDVKVKRDFWQWLKDTFEAPGMKARSAAPISTPDNSTSDSDTVATLTHLKAIYDSLNAKRTEGELKAKRGFWQWLKDTFEAPGMKARSATSISTSDNSTSDSNPVAALTHLKAIYDSLNAKRMEEGLKAKRGFWQWLEDHTYCEIGIPCE